MAESLALSSSIADDTNRTYAAKTVGYFSHCNLCAKPNDLIDFEYCYSCCLNMAYAQAAAEFPDSIDNMIGWLGWRLGISTLPIMAIMSGEATLSHFLHHAVILPSPIGTELGEIPRKLAKKIGLKNGNRMRQLYKANALHVSNLISYYRNIASNAWDVLRTQFPEVSSRGKVNK
jgi:hypothetical protein